MNNSELYQLCLLREERLRKKALEHLPAEENIQRSSKTEINSRTEIVPAGSDVFSNARRNEEDRMRVAALSPARLQPHHSTHSPAFSPQPQTNYSRPQPLSNSASIHQSQRNDQVIDLCSDEDDEMDDKCTSVNSGCAPRWMPPTPHRLSDENSDVRRDEGSMQYSSQPKGSGLGGLRGLRDAFPQIPEIAILDVLRRSNGDYNVCADWLLSWEPDGGSHSLSSSNEHSAAGSPSYHGICAAPIANRNEQTSSKVQTHPMCGDDDIDQENSNANRKRDRGSVSLARGIGQSPSVWEESASSQLEVDPPRVKRGRPPGSKDSKPRKRKGVVVDADLTSNSAAADVDELLAQAKVTVAPREESRKQPSTQRDAAIPRAAAPERLMVVHPPSPAPLQGAIQRREADSDRAMPPAAQVLHSTSGRPMYLAPPEEVWGKKYPDLRPWIIKTLCNLAEKQRHASRNDVVLHNTVRAAMQIALWPSPISKLKAAAKVKEVGPATVKALEAEYTPAVRRAPVQPPAEGKFAAPAAAALVALYDWEERHAGQDDCVCTLEELLMGTRERMDKDFRGHKLTDAPTDIGWMQVQKLMSKKKKADVEESTTQYIREVKRNKLPCFQLLEEGRTKARSLLAKSWNRECFEPFQQLHSDDGTVDAACHGAWLCMDHREGGGMSHSLLSMCNSLDTSRIPYFVRSLCVADYLWIVPGGRVAPVLVERKSAEDVALSMHDGRWESQQKGMLKARHAYKEKLRLIYVIEGEQSIVRGSNFVGNDAWRITMEDVNRELDTLRARGFEVISTKNNPDTERTLLKLHREVAAEVRAGTLPHCLTYAELDALKAAPDVALPAVSSLPPRSTGSAGVTGGSGPGGSTSAASRASTQDAKDAQSKNAEDVEDMTGSTAEASGERATLQLKSLKELKEACQERCEGVSGSKTDLVDRLLGPRKPQAWIDRMHAQKYAPQVNSANSALLVALLLNDRNGGGVEKDELMRHADVLGISKDSMFASKGNQGYYDGWSNAKALQNEPGALMRQKRMNKGKALYSLTSEGEELAAVMHKWAHQQGKCTCGDDV